MHAWIALTTALLGACTPTPPPSPPAQPEPPPRAQAALTGHVGTDGVVLVGLNLTLPPGWHVYWTNPGETGLPTRATLSAPEGWGTEGPLYPAPERFTSPGDIVSFGYAERATLLWRLSPPASWAQAELVVESKWLLCREICVPDGAELRLALTPGAQDPALPEALGLTPRPWAALAGAIATQSQVELTYTVPGAQSAELFPSADLALVLGGTQIEPIEGGLRVRLALRGPAPTGDAGVLTVTTGAGARIPVQLPSLPLQESP